MKRIILFMAMMSIGFSQAQTGKVGINTDSPKETLDIKGTIKVQDLPVSGVGKIYNGTDDKNTTFSGTKMVVADNNGALGVTEMPGGLKIQVVNLSTLNNYEIPANNTQLHKTPLSIEVPPGKWIYYITLGIEQTMKTSIYDNGTNFVRLRFLEHSESSNGANTINNIGLQSRYKFASYYVSQGFSFREKLGVVSGFLGINNNTNQTKTFYLYADNQGGNSGGGLKTNLTFNWSESSLIRMPVLDE